MKQDSPKTPTDIERERRERIMRAIAASLKQATKRRRWGSR